MHPVVSLFLSSATAGLGSHKHIKTQGIPSLGRDPGIPMPTGMSVTLWTFCSVDPTPKGPRLNIAPTISTLQQSSLIIGSTGCEIFPLSALTLAFYTLWYFCTCTGKNPKSCTLPSAAIKL